MPAPDLEDRPTPPFLRRGAELVQAPSAFQGLMARRGLLAILVLLGVVLLAASAILLAAIASDRLTLFAARATATPPLPDFQPPPSLEQLAEQYPQLADLLNDPALGSVYKDFIVAFETGGVEAARDLASLRGLLNDRDEIRVTLLVDGEENVPAIVGELERAGITVEGSYRHMINVGVPFSMIESLAEEEGAKALFEQMRHMEHIMRLELPVPDTPSRSLSVEGEGVLVTGANRWHAAGITGEGIRIGVLDVGFDGYRDLLGDELPANTTVESFAFGTLADETGDVHGTACAEIVHEMAPGAELFLALSNGSLVSRGMAADWLVEQGVHIISHSVGGYWGPLDGTDEAADMVDGVAEQGILWVNGSGNAAGEHYRGVFTDADGDGLHEFLDGEENIALWPYRNTSRLMITLLWDDWEQVTEDYDFTLYDSQGNAVYEANDTQDGSWGQEAGEGMIITQVTDEVYYISIEAYKITRAGTLDLYTRNAAIEFPMAEHSLLSPSDALGSLTVGATEHTDDSLAVYSSQGPTNDGRLKPEISAPAGVSGASKGSNGFNGTSASTPHVAGAAALVWSAFPEFSREEVIAYLESHALDLGSSGPDNAFGYGRLQLPAFEGAAATASPVPTSGPIPTTTDVAPGVTSTPPVGLAPAPIQPAPPPTDAGTIPSAPLLLGGLGAVGFCGGLCFLGAAGWMLRRSWRRETRASGLPSIPSVPPSPRGQAPSPLPVPPRRFQSPVSSYPTTDPDRGYGVLVGQGFRTSLRPGMTTIGRASTNDVALASDQISRHHARITCANGVCELEDLNSFNGTFVNHGRVTVVVLNPGDRLRFGNVRLTYRLSEREEERAWLEAGGEMHPVPDQGVTLGRSRRSDICLLDESVSRRHAQITLEDGSFVLTDLGSRNGTFVNGRPVRQHHLRDGDGIQVACSSLRFCIRRGA